nr:hypothetical protein [uncultured Butyrivibrio sp.]
MTDQHKTYLYGYDISRHSISPSNGLRTCHIGAYGFKTEDEALKQAIEKIKDKDMFIYYISLYKFDSSNSYRPSVSPIEDSVKIVVFDPGMRGFGTRYNLPTEYTYELCCERVFILESNYNLTLVKKDELWKSISEYEAQFR